VQFPAASPERGRPVAPHGARPEPLQEPFGSRADIGRGRRDERVGLTYCVPRASIALLNSGLFLTVAASVSRHTVWTGGAFFDERFTRDAREAVREI